MSKAGASGSGTSGSGGAGGSGLGGKGGTGGTSAGGTSSTGGNAGSGAGGHAGDGAGGNAGDGAGGAGTGGESGAGAGGEGGAGGDGGGGPDALIDGAVDLSSDPLGPGRVCAEAPAYAVAALTAHVATLSAAPDADCLASGDEVLLINLQGSPANHDNVGNWELLVIESIEGADVTFTANKTRFYGAASGSDQGIGSGATDQKVALIRVPRFGSLTVAETGVISAAPWDGSRGGVIALRAARLDVQGHVDASTLGYRSGRWSQDGPDCDDNLATYAGESISGPGIATTLRNVGGPGGISAQNDISFHSNSPISATPGHAQPGEPGINPNSRTLGEPGEAYGSGDGTRLTMGSAAGGNVTCTNEVTEPRYIDLDLRAGGIVLLLVDELTIGTNGSISATPPDAFRDVAFAGGYVYVRGTTLDVGMDRIHAQGSVGRGVNGPTLGQSNQASPGYIVLEGTTVTGITDPPANVID